MKVYIVAFVIATALAGIGWYAVGASKRRRRRLLRKSRGAARSAPPVIHPGWRDMMDDPSPTEEHDR